VLTQHQCPHPPHRHKEEEILLLLAGEIDIILPDLHVPEEDQRKRLQPGQFVYYPAQFAHTLQTMSEDPANYLMFRWYNNDATKIDLSLAFGHFNVIDPVENSEVKEGFCARLVFEGPTTALRKLHCHASTLTPGAGYDPHVDSYDAAIIVLEGEVETLGERVGPHSVIFFLAGEPHGMRNPGERVARYVVFEFHGLQIALADELTSDSLLAKLTDPQRWKRKLKHILKRFVAGA
jgi:quercetin dioxygenase-like cupin family protein